LPVAGAGLRSSTFLEPLGATLSASGLIRET